MVQDEEFLQRKDKAVRAVLDVLVSCDVSQTLRPLLIPVLILSDFPGSVQTPEEVQEAEGSGRAAGRGVPGSVHPAGVRQVRAQVGDPSGGCSHRSLVINEAESFFPFSAPNVVFAPFCDSLVPETCRYEGADNRSAAESAAFDLRFKTRDGLRDKRSAAAYLFRPPGQRPPPHLVCHLTSRRHVTTLHREESADGGGGRSLLQQTLTASMLADVSLTGQLLSCGSVIWAEPQR